MSTEGKKPSEAECEEMAAGLGKPKGSLKDKLPFGKKSKDDGRGDENSKKKYTLKDRINDIKTGVSQISSNFKEKRAQKKAAVSSDDAKKPGSGSRRMVYPYTMTAKVAQFPFKFHMNNSWFFRYFIYATGVSMPFFMFMGMKSYSPSNVAEWKGKRKEMYTPHH